MHEPRMFEVEQISINKMISCTLFSLYFEDRLKTKQRNNM